MTFQEKLFESTAQIRARAAELAGLAVATARSGATQAAGRVELLKTAGQELNKVARRHASRFVKQNRSLATAAGKDLRAFARSTYATFAHGGNTSAKPRTKAASGKRTNKKAG